MNGKRRQLFRVTHLFSLLSVDTKSRRGAGAVIRAGSAAPVLTLTTVSCVLLNLQLAWLLCDLSMCGSFTRPGIMLCLGRRRNTPVYPLIVCPSMGWGCGGTWTGEHGNQDTRRGRWELFEGQSVGCEWDRELLQDSDICWWSRKSTSL